MFSTLHHQGSPPRFSSSSLSAHLVGSFGTLPPLHLSSPTQSSSGPHEVDLGEPEDVGPAGFYHQITVYISPSQSPAWLPHVSPNPKNQGPVSGSVQQPVPDKVTFLDSHLIPCNIHMSICQWFLNTIYHTTVYHRLRSSSSTVVQIISANLPIC